MTGVDAGVELDMDDGVDDDLTNDVASLRAVLNEAAPPTLPGTV